MIKMKIQNVLSEAQFGESLINNNQTPPMQSRPYQIMTAQNESDFNQQSLAYSTANPAMGNYSNMTVYKLVRYRISSLPSII